MRESIWTEVLVGDLLHRWNVLEQGTIQIAKDLGVTKSAVCGQLRRQRLRGLRVDAHPERSGILARKPREPKPEYEVDIPPPRPSPRVEAVMALTEQAKSLTHRSCRYIEGDPVRGSLFCGEQTRLGSSYCPEHHKVCWKKCDLPLPIDLETFREARVIVRRP